MTSYLRDLGRRAVACPRWRWRRGMIVTLNTGQQTLVVMELDDAKWIATTVGWFLPEAWARLDPNPDLSDPATLGCLLALVREAWGDPTLYVRLSDTYRATDKKAAWEVHGWLDASRSPDGRSGSWRGWGWASEAETLVATLENAP